MRPETKKNGINARVAETLPSVLRRVEIVGKKAECYNCFEILENGKSEQVLIKKETPVLPVCILYAPAPVTAVEFASAVKRKRDTLCVNSMPLDLIDDPAVQRIYWMMIFAVEAMARKRRSIFSDKPLVVI